MEDTTKNEPGRESAVDSVDVNIIRRAHIKRLSDETGGVTAFAERVETNADYIWDLYT